jgi:hypothetical protein
MTKRLILLACCVGLLGAPVHGQDKKITREDPVHEELRALRRAVTEAFNKRNIDGLLRHLHKNIVVTWQNGEVSVGHDQIRKYYERMLVGDNRIVESVTADPKVARLAFLYGKNTAVAYGELNDHYLLRDGRDLALNSLFSATAVKDGNRWLIASYHASTDTFDNAVLHIAVRRTAYWVGGIALGVLIVVVVVFLLVLRRVRRRPALTGPA